MPASIVYRLSGGAANSNPAASLGGVMSTTAVAANALFDTVSAAEALSGDTEYRCFFILNDGDKALTNVRLWISDQADVGVLALALDVNGVSANGDGGPPVSGAFTSPTTIGAAIAVPDLAVGARHAVWARRAIAAATAGVALASNTAQFRVDFEYVP